jgi:AcrR family transcriptional regulator
LQTKRAVKKPVSQRSENAALRRNAIVEAALEEFVENGFAATRLDDVARRAGVAKGTIYLNFKDKEALFAAIVKQQIGPHIEAVKAMAISGGSLQEFLQAAFPRLVREMVEAKQGAVLRMFLAEAGRFPKLAKSYYQMVIEPGLEAIRTLAQRGVERGELSDRALVEFPQLLIAPLMLSVIWTGLFERFQHLDVERLVSVYLSHFTGGETATEARSGRLSG